LTMMEEEKAERTSSHSLAVYVTGMAAEVRTLDWR
jgi:hypothetical protein